MPRARNHELDPQLRSRICELHAVGWGYRRIRSYHPYLPLSTIQTTIAREKDRVNNVSRPRSGQPRKLSEDQRDRLYEMTETDPHVTYRDMLEEVDNVVCRRSIQNLMNEMGRRKWRQRGRPELKECHAIARLRWAREYAAFTPQQWMTVVWSDECTVERGVGARQIWTWLRPCEQLAAKDVHELRHNKGVKQMFWAAFGEGTRTGLVPLNGDPEAARGGVSSRVIHDLYAAFLPEIVRPGFIFMHDNASVYTAQIIQALLRDLGIRVMNWPPYSPDLNPIENLWALLKQQIYKDHPDLERASDTVETLTRLVQAAKEAWQTIRNDVIVRLSETMPHRVEAVIKADGWYTKY